MSDNQESLMKDAQHGCGPTICCAPPFDIKIFRLNDYEWWAGRSLDEIHAAYKDATGIDPNDPDEGFENPRQLTEEELCAKRIYYDNGEEAFDESFRARLDTMIALEQPFPCHFAGTEC